MFETMFEMVCESYGYLYVSSADPLKITSLPYIYTAVAISVHGVSFPVASSTNLLPLLAGNIPCFCFCSKCKFLFVLIGILCTDGSTILFFDAIFIPFF